MLQNSKARGIRFYLHVIIGLFFMFLLGRIFTPVYPLTDVGMQVLGVFLGVIKYTISTILYHLEMHPQNEKMICRKNATNQAKQYAKLADIKYYIF